MNKKQAFFLLFLIIIIWGVNWTVTKLIIVSVPPVWSAAIRSAIAAVALLFLQLASRQFIIPKQHDIPAILVICIFHMVLFGALMAVGLQYISVGRSIVLAYTTPLWVTPAAIFLLREPTSKFRIFGVILGISGVLILFNPSAESFSREHQLLGNALLLLASLSWAITIIFIKAYKWRSTPFQLVFWQNLLAAIILAAVALPLEGVPTFTVDSALIWKFAYSGLMATAFGFWGMTVVNRYLPAVVTSLGLLATPVVGMVCSQIVLGEKPDLALLIAGFLIIAGISIGCINTKPQE